EHLKELRAQHEDILRAKQKLLEQFAPKLGAGDPKNVQVWYELKLKHLGLAKEQLGTVKTRIRKHEVDLENQEKARERARSGEDITAAMVEQQLAKDGLIRRHLDKIAKLEQDIAELSGRVTPEGAETYLRPMQAALKSALAALEERRKELLPQVRKEVQETALSAL